MIASAPFQEVLSSALTPITLISGVGMLILCMTNRYSHCMDRIRGLVKIRTQGLKALRVEPDIDREIRLIYRRARWLRFSMLAITLSSGCSGLLVATNVFGTYFGFDAAPFAAIWLVLGAFAHHCRHRRLRLRDQAFAPCARPCRRTHAQRRRSQKAPRGGIEMTSFNELLASALAPITLISGVGLLMLSMSARYNHATSRIRLLMNERLDPKLTDDERADIDDEIDFIFHRAGLLRRGEFCVVLSAVVSGLLVALCVLEEATGFSADILDSALLLASVALIVLSTVFLSLEIRLSLRAIKLVVSKLPPVADAFDDAVAARAAQAVEARHQSHVLNEARRQAEHAASHEVRKAEGGHSA